jgi:hypothetical protein
MYSRVLKSCAVIAAVVGAPEGDCMTVAHPIVSAAMMG